MGAPKTLPFPPKLADPAGQYRKQFDKMHGRVPQLAEGFDRSTELAEF